MKRISIERYKDPAETQYAGLIEGETDSGDHWVLWLDSEGRPEVFYSNRDENGAVRGQPVFVWRDLNLKDWGTSDHPMTWEEAHSGPGATWPRDPMIEPESE